MMLSASLTPLPRPGWSNIDGSRRVSAGVMPIVVSYQWPDTHDTLTRVAASMMRAPVRAHVGLGVSWCQGVRSLSSSGQIERKEGDFVGRSRHDTAPDTLGSACQVASQLNIGGLCPFQGAWRGELGDRAAAIDQVLQLGNADNLVARQPGAGASEISGLTRRRSSELDSRELDSSARALARQRYPLEARLITDQPALPAGTRRAHREGPAGGYPPFSRQAPRRPPPRVLSPICRTLPANWQPKNKTPATSGRGFGCAGVASDPSRATNSATLARRFGEVKL